MFATIRGLNFFLIVLFICKRGKDRVIFFHQKIPDVFWKIRRHSLGDVITLAYDRESGLWKKNMKRQISVA